MILRINADEWIMLQDVLSSSNWRHSEQERNAFKQKLNDAFNEQCSSTSAPDLSKKEDIDVN